MKTPEEIKKIELALIDFETTCGHCPYEGEPNGCNRPGGTCKMFDVALDAAEAIEQLEAQQPRWISVNDRLPDNEVDVLICVTRKHYSNPSKYIRFVTKAFHTDGKTNTEHSRYVWSTWDIDMDYDEEADDYIIPEGWWESVDYGDEFNAVDDFITHWMPLPEAPKEG